MPVIVRNLDNDAASIIMVDSDIQRERLLPSERDFAYKWKLNAMKRIMISRRKIRFLSFGVVFINGEDVLYTSV